MHEYTNGRLVLNAPAQNMLRILIASYFLAGAIGLIPGCDLTPLFSQFLAEPFSGIAAAAVVFSLAYLVMIGVWLRGAALTLGMLTFWASYLRMLDLGVTEELGTFWRDLALVASLMLTYAEANPDNHDKLSVVQHAEDPKAPEETVQPRATAEKQTRTLQGANFLGQPEPVSVEELERIFREEFQLARTG